MAIETRACLRTAYANQREARQKINQILRGRNRSKGVPPANRIYKEVQCYCGYWHLSARNGKG